MSAVLERKFDCKGPGAFEELAVEGSRGKEGASWQAVENAGKSTGHYVGEYRFPASYHRASRRSRRCHDVVYVPKLQQFHLGGLHVGGFQLGRSSWWCAICGEIFDWRAPNRLLVGDSASRAKVFKAHAVPQGVCVCKKLDQCTQAVGEPADSPIQSIATGLCERSRKGIMEPEKLD